MLKSLQQAKSTPAKRTAAAAAMSSYNVDDSFVDLRQDLQGHINTVVEHLASHGAEISPDKIKKSADSVIYQVDTQGKLAGKLAQWVNEVHAPMLAQASPQLPVAMQLNPALSNQLQFFMRLYGFHQNPNPLQRDLLWLMVAGQPFHAKMLPVLLSSLRADDKKYSEALADLAFLHFSTDFFPITFSKEVQTAVFARILTKTNPPYDYLRSRLLGMMSVEDSEHYLMTLHQYEINLANLGTVLEALFCRLPAEKRIEIAQKMQEINKETHKFDEAILNQLLQKNTEIYVKRMAEKKASPGQRILDIFALEAAARETELLILMDETHQHIDKMAAEICAPQTRIEQCTAPQLLDAIKRDGEYRRKCDPWPIPVLNARNQLIIPTYCKIAASLTKEQQGLIIKPDYLVRLLQSLVLAVFGAHPKPELQTQIIQMQGLLSRREDIERYIRFIIKLFAEGASKVSDFNSLNYHHPFSEQWLNLLCVLVALHQEVDLKHYLSYEDVCTVLSGWHDFHAMTAAHPQRNIVLFDKISILTNIMKPEEQKVYLAEQFANKSRSILWLAAIMQLPFSTDAAPGVLNQISNRNYICAYKNLISYLPACFDSVLKESPLEFFAHLMRLLDDDDSSETIWPLINLLMKAQTPGARHLVEVLIPELLKGEKTFTTLYSLVMMSPYFSAQQEETFFALWNALGDRDYLGVYTYAGLRDFILSNPHTPFNQHMLRMIIPSLLRELADVGWHRRTSIQKVIAKAYPLLSSAEKEQALCLMVDKFSQYNEYDIADTSIMAQPTIGCIAHSVAEGMSPDLLVRLAESIINQLFDPENSHKKHLAKYAASILSYLSSCLAVIPGNAPLHAKISEISKRIQEYYVATGQIPAESINKTSTTSDEPPSKLARTEESSAAGSSGIRLFERPDSDEMDSAADSSQTLGPPNT